MRTRPPPKDHFGNLIEVGDRYFYGSPSHNGTVIKIMGGSIMLDLGPNRIGEEVNMKCKSPEKGVCLDKIPSNAKTVYKVTWKIWKGVEPCGRAEYSHHSQLFDNLSQATECFNTKSLHHKDATLTKISTEIINGV